MEKQKLEKGGDVEGCDGEMREGVQEYECVCIFKAVFLLQEEEKKQ